VTCLCLTRNRRQWLPIAIRCFQSQTYQNKELLILADGEDVSDLVTGNNIRYVHIAEGSTIGDKRNLGSSLAKDDFVCSWDDDDWNASVRLEDQMARLLQSNKSVTSYHSMLFSDGREWWKFHGHSTSNLGTSLCYRKSWWQDHRFPSKQIGEDSDFIFAAASAAEHISTDAGLLMVASIHKENTSPRQLQGASWEKIEKPEGLECYQ
jgi:O-antigen biosynthesis protein